MPLSLSFLFSLAQKPVQTTTQQGKQHKSIISRDLALENNMEILHVRLLITGDDLS